MPKIKYSDLISLAQSDKPSDQKQALDIYEAWVKAAPKLDAMDRLNATERIIMDQIFRNLKLKK